MVLPTHTPGVSAVSAVLCLLALCTSLRGADAHVFMTAPLSRVRVLGNPDWVAAGGNGLGNPIRYYPDGSFYNDKADVCGDPHQQNDGGVGGFTGAVNNPQPWSGTLSSGPSIAYFGFNFSACKHVCLPDCNCISATLLANGPVDHHSPHFQSSDS